MTGLTWHVPVMVATHAALVVWAYRRGVEHACDALLQRVEGETEGMQEAADWVRP